MWVIINPRCFSVTPGLHTRPDLIYVPNICLWWDTNTLAHAPTHTHVCTPACRHIPARKPTHDHSDYKRSQCLEQFHLMYFIYFNNMSMIWQNMPACLKQGNKGKRGNGVGLGDIYAHVRGYEFTSESRSRPCRKLFTSSIPSLPSPCCFKRLLLRQSAGICLQNCYVWDRDVNHALHVLYWIYLCDESV